METIYRMECRCGEVLIFTEVTVCHLCKEIYDPSKFITQEQINKKLNEIELENTLNYIRAKKFIERALAERGNHDTI